MRGSASLAIARLVLDSTEFAFYEPPLYTYILNTPPKTATEELRVNHREHVLDRKYEI